MGDASLIHDMYKCLLLVSLLQCGTSLVRHGPRVCLQRGYSGTYKPGEYSAGQEDKAGQCIGSKGVHHCRIKWPILFRVLTLSSMICILTSPGWEMRGYCMPTPCGMDDSRYPISRMQGCSDSQASKQLRASSENCKMQVEHCKHTWRWLRMSSADAPFASLT